MCSVSKRFSILHILIMLHELRATVFKVRAVHFRVLFQMMQHLGWIRHAPRALRSSLFGMHHALFSSSVPERCSILAGPVKLQELATADYKIRVLYLFLSSSAPISCKSLFKYVHVCVCMREHGNIFPPVMMHRCDSLSLFTLPLLHFLASSITLTAPSSSLLPFDP